MGLPRSVHSVSEDCLLRLEETSWSSLCNLRHSEPTVRCMLNFDLGEAHLAKTVARMPIGTCVIVAVTVITVVLEPVVKVTIE